MRINVVDKMARKQYAVEPRQYEGRLLHQLPLLRTPLGDIYVELYLNEPSDSNGVALYRRGTRVIDDLTLLDHFARAPRNLRYLQGHLVCGSAIGAVVPTTACDWTVGAPSAALSSPLRRLPTEIRGEVLRIRPDHVIEDMFRGFGANVVEVQAPFQPEGGAYSGHGHHHGRDESGHHHDR